MVFIQKIIALIMSIFTLISSFFGMGNEPEKTVKAQGEDLFRASFVTGKDTEGKLTDEYGNVTFLENGSALVREGKYSFVITDGGRNRTEGEITVTGNAEYNVQLPEGEWFKTVRLLDKDKNEYESNLTGEGIHALIPDRAGIYDVYLYAEPGSVPDSGKTQLRAKYTGTDGEDKSEVSRSWNSYNSNLAYLLDIGTQGKEFTLEAVFTDENGYRQIQSLPVKIDRQPTADKISAMSGGINLLTDFDPNTESYALSSITDTAEISVSADEKYEIEIDGVKTNKYQVNCDGNIRTVKVSFGGQSKIYKIRFEKKAPVTLTLTHQDDTFVTVSTESGEDIQPESEGVYRLIPGSTYIVDGVKEEYYHVSCKVTPDKDMSLDIPSPAYYDDPVEDIKLYDRSGSASRKEYVFQKDFHPWRHKYFVTVSDAANVIYVQASVTDDYSIYALYTDKTNGQPVKKAITSPVSSDGRADYLKGCVSSSGFDQDLTVRAEKTEGGFTYYQDYEISIRKKLHLSYVSVSVDGAAAPLRSTDNEFVSFDREICDYNIIVPADAKEAVITAEGMNDDYIITFNGKYNNVIDLNASLETETVIISVAHKNDNSEENFYILNFIKVTPLKLTVETIPDDTCVFLTQESNSAHIYEEDGVFSILPGEKYSCIVTAQGYVGKEEKHLSFSGETAKLTLSLSKAKTAEPLTEYESDWSATRKDRYNNAVTDSPIPVQADKAVLYWASKIGEGTDSEACGCPIIVDDYLIVYSGNKLCKTDKYTGKIVQTGTMYAASSYAINTPTYADGMIFVGLSNGMIQAFSAETLESLWIYRNPNGGQPDCPIIYSDGYVYTGFWQGETMDADYVCVNVTDEDPDSQTETKLPCWTFTHRGGFYWSAPVVNEKYLILAGDDGEGGSDTGYPEVFTIDPRSGKIIDSLLMPLPGDIRCGMTYDSATDSYYFTSKGGWMGKVSVSADGMIDGSSLKILLLTNGFDGYPAMSTSTPTIYNKRAYIGVSGKGQFNMYSGHNISVIDIEKMETVYTVDTQGYPQSGGLLTTAYDKGNGEVYICFFDNFTPGKLRIIKDRPGQTRPDTTVRESYDFEGRTLFCDAAPVLFTPCGEHAQYSICSPIADSDGTIYFKNDSGYLFALGSTPEKMTVVNAPRKTSYTEGESFSPEGMKVTAESSNGTVRDITGYIEYSSQPLTKDDTDFIIYYPQTLYQNGKFGAGTKFTAPISIISLSIAPKYIQGDVDGDGEITLNDGDMVYAYHLAERSLTAEQLKRADMNDDGKVNALDAAMIYYKVNRE